MAFRLIAALLLVLSAIGCMQRDGRNSDCRWPGETPLHFPDARHLSADAEFAEDLAIRYADVHHGLRTPNFVSGEDYDAARDACRATLFEQVAKDHHVAVTRIFDSLGRNRERIDLLMNLPYAMLYCFAATLATRRIWRRYPPQDNGWTAGIIMTLFLSLVFAFGCAMLGEVWSWVMESYRVGNPHMTFRVERLPWTRYRTGLFVAAVLVFWVAAADAARRCLVRVME